MEQNDVIRVCNPTLFSSILESDHHRLTGIFAPNVYEYSVLLERITNLTAYFDASYPGIGRRIGDTEEFDGCLGKLQRGEMDLIPAPINYGMDIVNVSQGFIAFDEKVSFMGAFARPNATKPADFARSLYAFEYSTYLLIIVYLIMFHLVFVIRRKILIRRVTKLILSMRQHRANKLLPTTDAKLRQVYYNRISLADVLRHFLQSNFIEAKSNSLTVLVSTLTLFSFLTMAYFTSRLNTELVVPEKAKMYENYDQIMKAGVKPVFMRGMTNYEDLKYASNGSKAKIFWDWAVEKFQEKNLFVESKLTNFGHYSVEGLKGEVLIFSGEIITKTLKTTTCEVIGRSLDRLMYLLSYIRKIGNFDHRKYEDSQAYIRHDQSAQSFIKSIVFSEKFLRNPYHYRVSKTLFLRIYEHGHIQRTVQWFETANLYDLQPGLRSLIGPSVATKWEIKNICKSNNVPVPKIPRIDHVNLSNLRYSAIACLAFLVISILVFVYECLSMRKKKIKVAKTRPST